MLLLLGEETSTLTSNGPIRLMNLKCLFSLPLIRMDNNAINFLKQ
jgi:hypothetical protein